ncbi:YifB family Mg chelatase-like AAA ATPase [Candidatus Dojkabacteria bacterium]|nr:YifB family Mg chelatase-like AAA ATPase [Candidatus Dojkabacteria bacterium]
MVFRVYSSTTYGVTGQMVTVEASTSNSLPSIRIVGLPDKAVEDAKERVWPAIKNSGLSLIPKKITINLAPSYIPKTGASLDLPIAISILGAYKHLPQKICDEYLFIGELSLSGEVKYSNGILQAIDIMETQGLRNIIIPKDNLYDIPLSKTFSGTIFYAQRFNEVLRHLNGIKILPVWNASKQLNIQPKIEPIPILLPRSEAHIAQIAAAGDHHIITVGSPGCGKTLTAKAISQLMPKLTPEKIYETALIYSSSAHKTPTDLISLGSCPIRTPHHTSSYASIIGGGTKPSPGEISLAHNGVLFLDELPEFGIKTLNALREPLEEGNITIARAEYRVLYPCRFLFIAAMNPCPCGYFNDPEHECTCQPFVINRYFNKVSKVLLDRIDIYKYITRPENLANSTCTDTEISALKTSIFTAQEIQKTRFSGTKLTSNSQLSYKQIKEYCELTNEAEDLLNLAYKKLALSPRAFVKIARVGRTIADLKNSRKVKASHITEALSYRSEQVKA